MNRGVLLAAIAALALAAPAVAQAQGIAQPGLGPAAAAQPLPPVNTPRPAGVLPPLPLPPAQHADIPSLPPDGSGFAWDPATHHYVAEGGNAIWVAGHYANQPSGRTWVEGQWMYKGKPGAAGYGDSQAPSHGRP